MRNDGNKKVFFISLAFIVFSIVILGYGFIFSAGESTPEGVALSTGTITAVPVPFKPKYVRGVHLTSWVAGSKKMREPINKLLEETEINSVVIDIKEYEGEIYVPGYDKAEKYRTYVNAIPDFEKYIAELKKKKVYVIARIVVFKDSLLPKKRPDLAVKSSDGGVWKDRAGLTWLDPFNKECWDYNIGLAEHCVKMGFDEVQFDYIRFPSDGNTHKCRYSVKHSSASAAAAIDGFLEEASSRLKPLGANVSIDVFGLTTTVNHDMGIGQKIVEMTKFVDFVSPMAYPSHYAKGEYGIPDPNSAPYHTVYLSLESAKYRVPRAKLRPYLQDFSLGVHYGEKEVREQIQACYDNDVGEWLLWNPRCVYTRSALRPKKDSLTYEKKPLPSYIKERKPPKAAVASKPAQGVTGIIISSGTIIDTPSVEVSTGTQTLAVSTSAPTTAVSTGTPASVEPSMPK